MKTLLSRPSRNFAPRILARRLRLLLVASAGLLALGGGAQAGFLNPEINVRGNGQNIFDGDPIPSFADGTDFGIVDPVAGSAQNDFLIENLGNGSLSLTGNPRVAISGPNASDFIVVLQPSPSVGSGGSTTFRVRFDPSAPGVRAATLTIFNNDSNENPYDFAIRGTGSESAISVLGNSQLINNGDFSPNGVDGTDFGVVDPAGGFINESFTIENAGPGTLLLTGNPRVTTTGSEFQVISQPAPTVPPGGSTSFTVRFDPITGGTRNSTIAIPNNDLSENPYRFGLRGTGAEPDIEVLGNGTVIFNGDPTPSPADFTDFGNVNSGSDPAVRPFLVRNTGTGNLQLTGAPAVQIGGAHAAEFVVTQAPSPTLLPGAVGGFQITFDPSGTGLRTATVSIANDVAGKNPYTFAISGRSLSFEDDSDGDGMSDAAESQWAALGFDWEVSQPGLVATFNANASAAGYYNQTEFDDNRTAGQNDVLNDPNSYDLYTLGEIQDLNVGVPLLQADGSGQFKLTICLEQSVDLINFVPLPFTDPETTVNGEGKVEFLFPAPAGTTFFRLGSQ